MHLFSPAKINLFLKIHGKRSDGFHELSTLFHRISILDEMIFKSADRAVNLVCTYDKPKRWPNPLPCDASNLVMRAGQLLKDTCRVRWGADIQLLKRIPTEAGLGGGSSNAATTLIGLNRLWKLKLNMKQLMAIGAKIGSDVPFFLLSETSALAWGRGEKLKACASPKKPLWFVVSKPDFGISTALAYKNLGLSADQEFVRSRGLTSSEADARIQLRCLGKDETGFLGMRLTNHLEQALDNGQSQKINFLKDQLNGLGAIGSLMSGSGSSVFGLFSSKAKAKSAAQTAQKKLPTTQIFLAQSY